MLYKGLSEYENNSIDDYDIKELCNHIENIRGKLKIIPYIDLVVEPNKEPYEKQIDNDLCSLEEKIESDIEVLYPFDGRTVVDRNEEGKLSNLPYNRNVTEFLSVNETFVIVGINNNRDFRSLDEKQIEKLKNIFHIEHTKDFFKRTIGNVLKENNSKYMISNNFDR